MPANGRRDLIRRLKVKSGFRLRPPDRCTVTKYVQSTRYYGHGVGNMSDECRVISGLLYIF